MNSEQYFKKLIKNHLYPVKIRLVLFQRLTSVFQNKIKSFASFIIFMLGVMTFLVAQPKVPDRPNPPRLVNDFAGVFTPDEIGRLESEVDAYSDSSSNQIVILSVRSLGDYAIEDWALEVGRKWGVGFKQKNNGVVIIISQEPRKINISPGYGLEGALPDLLCKRIEQQDMVPAFKEGRFYDGMHNAITDIRTAVKGEFVNENIGKNVGSGSDVGFWIFIIILILLVIFFMYISNRSRYAQYGSRSRGFGLGPNIFFGGGGSIFGGGNSDSGGDSGGGSFGGFGGGDFGGGGASSDW